MTEPLTPPEPREKKHRPFFRLMPKVASEGYCCINGYLRLCRARGETKKSMAEFLGISFWTIKYNYRCLKRGEHKCQNYSDCLSPVIEDIERSRGGSLDDPQSGKT